MEGLEGGTEAVELGEPSGMGFAKMETTKVTMEMRIFLNILTWCGRFNEKVAKQDGEFKPDYLSTDLYTKWAWELA